MRKRASVFRSWFAGGLPGRPHRHAIESGGIEARFGVGAIVEMQIYASANESRKHETKRPHRRVLRAPEVQVGDVATTRKLARRGREPAPERGDGVGRQVAEQALGDDRQPLAVLEPDDV